MTASLMLMIGVGTSLRRALNPANDLSHQEIGAPRKTLNSGEQAKPTSSWKVIRDASATAA